MAVRKIKGRWKVDIRIEGVRRRITSPEDSKSGAQAYESVIRQRASNGLPLIPVPQKLDEKSPFFKEMAKWWYETYVVINNKPSEQQSKQLIMRLHLIPFFGRYRISEISTMLVEQYKATKQRSGLAPKTINNHLTVLMTCLRTAKEWNYEIDLPKAKHLNVPQRQMDYLDFDEAERLINSSETVKGRLMILIALRTGVRLGEILGLRWEDVNTRTNTLTVSRSIFQGSVGSPKSGKIRHIPLTNEVRNSLLNYGISTGYIFGLDDGRPPCKRTIQKILNRACDTAGIKRVGWHTLRHTFASHLAMKGQSMKAIQELLGHADIKTTMRYAHLSPSTLLSAISVLEPKKFSAIEIFGHQMGTQLEMIPLKNKKNPD